MFRSDRSSEWLIEKYGVDVRPWECRVILDNKDWQQTLQNGHNKIRYTYSLYNEFAVGSAKVE